MDTYKITLRKVFFQIVDRLLEFFQIVDGYLETP